MKVSYFITPYNRGAQAKRTLDRLMKLTLPDEVIVLNDDSTDQTDLLLKDHPIGKLTEYHYLFRKKPAGVTYDACSIPRNICLKQSKSDYVLFADPEVLFVTDVVSQLKQIAERDSQYMVCAGTVYLMNDAAPIDDRVSDDPYLFINQIWDVRPVPKTAADGNPPSSVTKTENWAATFACLCKREWLMDIGGWDEDMSLLNGGGGYAWDDTDMATRLRLTGHNQNTYPEVVAIHQWHERPPGQIGQIKNSEIFFAKNLQEDQSQLVANKGREWGIL